MLENDTFHARNLLFLQDSSGEPAVSLLDCNLIWPNGIIFTDLDFSENEVAGTS